MKKTILAVMTFLLPSVIFASGALTKQSSFSLAQNETAEQDISSKLELTIVAYNIVRDEFGKAMSPSIKYWIRNISDGAVSFPFQRGMIWYWEKSIDSQPFEAMGAGDWDPSLYKERVVLGPGEIIRGSISGSSYVRGSVSKIQLRYNREPYYTLLSNELDLSIERWGNKTHTDDPDCLNGKLTLSIRRSNKGLEAIISNISKESVSFYFETCPICFWSISVNGGEWQSLSRARHQEPCVQHNTVTLMPGENITYALPEHYLNGIKTLKLRYRYGSYEEKHMVLESDIFMIQ